MGTIPPVAGAPYGTREASADAAESPLRGSRSAPRVAGASPERWTRTGVFLIAISFVLWAPLPAVPLLPLSTPVRAGVGGGMLLGAEVAFWLGVVISGPQALQKLREGWRAWLRAGR